MSTGNRTSLKSISPFDGFTLYPLTGEKLMMVLVEIEENAQLPLHSHPHEQGGIVLEGTLELQIDGVTHRFEHGEMYMIPGGVVHGGQAIGGPSLVMDVFTPPRDDYRPE